MRLSAHELDLIFDALQAKYGRGWSKDQDVGRLQAKLSVMLEAATQRESMRQKEQ